MIYLPEHQISFIAVPKCASQSIAAFLPNAEHHKIWSVHTKRPCRHFTANEAIAENFCPASTTFIGVIRHPYERLLSQYFHRINKGHAPPNPNRKEFHHRFDGGVMRDYRHYQISQSDYLRKSDVWWSFDYLAEHMQSFAGLVNIPYSNFDHVNSTPGNKRELIDIFFSPYLKHQVKTVYAKDFELYERTTKRSADLYGIRS